MARWIDVCALDAVPGDRPLGLTVEGVAVALVRRDDAVAAVADRCPHLAFPLSRGSLHEGRLVCALHRWSFDLFDPPPGDLPPEARCERYPVRVRQGRVLIDLDGDSTMDENGPR